MYVHTFHICTTTLGRVPCGRRPDVSLPHLKLDEFAKSLMMVEILVIISMKNSISFSN